MINVSMSAPDIGFQAADIGKGVNVGTKGPQTDQFKKLLQSRQDDGQDASDVREASKDAKPDKAAGTGKDEPKKTDAPKKSDPDQDVADVSDEAEEANPQADELLAAYQMSQGLRPDVLAADPEVVVELPTDSQESAAELQTAVDAVLEEATELNELQVALPDVAGVRKVQVPVVDAQSESGQTENFQVKESQTKEVSPETVQAEPERKETVKAASAREGGQTDEHLAERSAAAPTTPMAAKAPEENVSPQETVKIYVPQQEELPDKLAEQIMTKMDEGVQSFEVEIEPENLGKISIRILYEEGQTTVSILCAEKRALDVLGNHAREIGGIIDRNLGGETKIIVERQEPDYLEQNANKQGRQDAQEQPRQQKQNEKKEDFEQFFQKLRLGLTV